eukprot:gene4420-7795_t
MKQQIFELTSEDKVTILFYKNIKNIDEIKKLKFNASFINTSMIVSIFQVLVSTYKSLNTNKTNDFYSEIIYNLGISKNISTNLNAFGIESDPNNILIVMLNVKEEELKNIKNIIKNDEEKEENNLSIDEEIKNEMNIEKIKKLYKLSNLKSNNVIEIEKLIISKLSIRDL